MKNKYKSLLSVVKNIANWHFNPQENPGEDLQNLGLINLHPSHVEDMKARVNECNEVNCVDIYADEVDNYESNLLAWSKRDHLEVGYLPSNTTYRQYAYKEDIPEYIHNIFQEFNLSDAYANINRIDPGNILPWHFDSYNRMRKGNENLNLDFLLKTESNIMRILIFLDDWHWGHFFQVGNAVKTHWKRGESITWHPFRYHLAANCGILPRYTLTITGNKK